MKFVRDEDYMFKLNSLAFFDEKRVITDAEVIITRDGGKLKAYCPASRTYLQFPRHLRDWGDRYVADVVEVIRDDGVRKYYRAMKGSIRKPDSDEVLA